MKTRDPRISVSVRMSDGRLLTIEATAPQESWTPGPPEKDTLTETDSELLKTARRLVADMLTSKRPGVLLLSNKEQDQ